MTPDKIFAIIFTVFGIGFTYWYFLMKKDEVVSAKNEIDVVVQGGYNPRVIAIPQGKTTKINFIRKDKNSCLEEIVISDFKIKKYLPLNEKVTIELAPEEKGEYPYSCGMNMFHGKFIVQ
ncbi:MAG: cupredoxin domain-containing protein [Candidatus Levybacteria bacterium]|nr:cupredoxin domain-containing protein [Candidatus Levybacteria bacterium]MBI2420905.1 cupredoxin domain-containing protein [Candidatus Levybacteria bacterium]